jgi:hypothetical protein
MIMTLCVCMCVDMQEEEMATRALEALASKPIADQMVKVERVSTLACVCSTFETRRDGETGGNGSGLMRVFVSCLVYLFVCYCWVLAILGNGYSWLFCGV